MAKIKFIKAREILNSKGDPTVEVDLFTDDGLFQASVPSGASKGKYEALELRDGEKRYKGMGVLKAVKNINEIIGPKLVGKDATQQKEIDELMIELDGTENKSKLGANAILAVSMAVCRAGAKAENLSLWEYISGISHASVTAVSMSAVGTKKRGARGQGKCLQQTATSAAGQGGPGTMFLGTCSQFRATSAAGRPIPCLLMIEGGLHAGNDLDVQEFMIAPLTSSGQVPAESFKEKLRIGVEIYHVLEIILKKKFGKFAANVGLEGGFAPPAKKTKEALDLIMMAIDKAGYKNKVMIILDIAASCFYKNKKYNFEEKIFSSEKLLDFYLDLIKDYPIFGLEDPFSQDDWEGWKLLKLKVKNEKLKVFLMGDDLTVTNPARISRAIKEDCVSAVVIKPNQIGTVTETIEAAKLAFEAGWEVFVKHRSGETNDDFIADLAVGIGAKYIMAGAPTRGERVAKYNRLLRIERPAADIARC